MYSTIGEKLMRQPIKQTNAHKIQKSFTKLLMKVLNNVWYIIQTLLILLKGTFRLKRLRQLCWRLGFQR